MKIKRILAIGITIMVMSCNSEETDWTPIVGGPSNGNNPPPVAEESLVYTPTASLKGTASFPVGTVISAGQLSQTQRTTILNTEFNSLTAENDMKMANMFTGPDTYDFSDGDAIVAYAQANGIRVFGHTLVWHQSIPQWLQDFAGTDEEFETQVENYIKATVAHFAMPTMMVEGQEVSVVAGWDVVNEAFTTDANNAVFRQRMGEDYVSRCFQWAREADPDVQLFYNDYNLESDAAKVSEVITMVDDFNMNDIPIDGIGLQMHIDYEYPDLATITSNLSTLTDTGLLIHFSEMDITVNRNEALTELTFERALLQKDRYEKIVALYNDTVPPDQQFGITVWGMRDTESWLLGFWDNPNEWPLLFNENYEYKIAHEGFIEGLE